MTFSLFSLGRDERGIAAVEFALLAPVLIAFYMGTTEFCQGYMAQKRMGHVSAMVADLAAQNQTLTPAAIDDIFSISQLIMKPFPTTTLSQRVSSVTRTNGVATVDWSRGHGMTKLSAGAVVDVPAELIGNGESVIMTEVSYDYDSPVDYLMPTVTKFSHRYFLRPRVVNKVACASC